VSGQAETVLPKSIVARKQQLLEIEQLHSCLDVIDIVTQKEVRRWSGNFNFKGHHNLKGI
jgi:hypothetical protein